mmetsp:Transcript_11992/g.36537  ORF Transcript_11992/g.36537 Transcript_11992/m.36537 type:complete len:181 (-) Transcript_11992:309-851(-)
MLLVVHGFCSQVQALQFEWNWQHPSKQVWTKSRKTGAIARLQILQKLLESPPWCHLPLNVTIVEDSEELLDDVLVVPDHMKLDVAPVGSILASEELCSQETHEAQSQVVLCCSSRDLQLWLCQECKAENHFVCAALRATVGRGLLVPKEAACCACDSVFDWTTILRCKLLNRTGTTQNQA